MQRPLVVILALLCVGQLALSLIQRAYTRDPASIPIAVTDTTPGGDSRPNLIDSQQRKAKTLVAHESGSMADDGEAQPIAAPQSAGKDPFKPFFTLRDDRAPHSSVELTDVALKDIRVTAVLHTATGRASASVETVHGRTFVVVPGSPIGTKGGRVTEISPLGVVVSEPGSQVMEADGGSEITTVLQLYRRQR